MVQIHMRAFMKEYLYKPLNRRIISLYALSWRKCTLRKEYQITATVYTLRHVHSSF